MEIKRSSNVERFGLLNNFETFLLFRITKLPLSFFEIFVDSSVSYRKSVLNILKNFPGKHPQSSAVFYEGDKKSYTCDSTKMSRTDNSLIIFQQLYLFKSLM